MSIIEIDRLYPTSEAFPMMGVGHTRGYEEIAAGKIKAKKNGKRTLIAASEIRRYIESLPDAEPGVVPSSVQKAVAARQEKRAQAGGR